MYFAVMLFLLQAPNSSSLDGHGGQFSFHLSHQVNRGLSLSMNKTFENGRIRICHPSTIPGTSSHSLVNTERNVNSL